VAEVIEMVKRGGWLGLVLMLAAGACSREEQVVEPRQVEAEPAAEPSVRSRLSELLDGTITERRIELEPSDELSEADEAFFAERIRELSELELSESDRALLAEYAAIEALYAQNSPAAGPQDAAARTAPPVEGALFGVETRDHALWLMSADDGSRYTVTTKHGAILAEEIDAATLERDYPALHDLVHAGFDLIGVGY
jgi:hypothetical protein